MAAWRKRAIELLPEFRKDLALEDYSPYQLFSDLLPRIEQAHVDGDEELLRRGYGFAAWCASQDAKDLWKAAGVAFYEHVFDRWNQRRLVVPWLSPQIIADSWGLWEMRLNPAQLAELRHLFANRREHTSTLSAPDLGCSGFTAGSAAPAGMLSFEEPGNSLSDRSSEPNDPRLVVADGPASELPIQPSPGPAVR